MSKTETIESQGGDFNSLESEPHRSLTNSPRK
jgi:hypothetical protein